MNTPYKPKGKLDALLDSLGITIVPTHRRRQAAQSHARNTMHKIREKYGDGHLVFVLRCIRETKNNSNELWGVTIGAISDIFSRRPDWAEKGGQVLDAFDNIPLGELREKAIKLRSWPVRTSLRMLIYTKLEEYLDEPPPRLL